MALDAFGHWNPLCGIAGCRQDAAPDGIVEVAVLIAGKIRTARIHVCASHLLECETPAGELATL